MWAFNRESLEFCVVSQGCVHAALGLTRFEAILSAGSTAIIVLGRHLVTIHPRSSSSRPSGVLHLQWLVQRTLEPLQQEKRAGRDESAGLQCIGSPDSVGPLSAALNDARPNSPVISSRFSKGPPDLPQQLDVSPSLSTKSWRKLSSATGSEYQQQQQHQQRWFIESRRAGSSWTHVSKRQGESDCRLFRRSHHFFNQCVMVLNQR